MTDRTLLKEQETPIRCISCTFYRSDGKCLVNGNIWKPEEFCSRAIRKKDQLSSLYGIQEGSNNGKAL